MLLFTVRSLSVEQTGWTLNLWESTTRNVLWSSLLFSRFEIHFPAIIKRWGGDENNTWNLILEYSNPTHDPTDDHNVAIVWYKLDCSCFLKTFPTSWVLIFYLHLSQIYWSSTLPQTIKVFDKILFISGFLAFLRWYMWHIYIYISNKIGLVKYQLLKLFHSLCSAHPSNTF